MLYDMITSPDNLQESRIKMLTNILPYHPIVALGNHYPRRKTEIVFRNMSQRL